jgi:transcriptional regulator
MYIGDMYLPSHFREERLDVLHAFIERHPLGALVAASNDGLTADHLPMLLARDTGARGTLHGHVARANPLWRSLAAGSGVLVLFGGADAYVSPSWYPSKAATGKVVPTWNYAVVHVRGSIRFFEDAARLHALVAALTNHHERTQASPWSVDDAPERYVQAQLRAIVGFEIEIFDIVGKFKASQNRSQEDRAGVRASLQSRNAEDLEELVRSPATSERGQLR